MSSPIKQICEHSDHFWYPEIHRYLKKITKNSYSLVKIHTSELYKTKLDTFWNDLTVLVSKILHSLKLFFSKHYKASFEKSVEILCASEKHCLAALDWQKKIPTRPVKAQLIFSSNKEIEKIKAEKDRTEKLQISQAVEHLQACLHMRRIRHQFVSLKERLQANEKLLIRELEIISLLSKFQEHQIKLKDLNDHKPKGWKAFFKKECTQNQSLRSEVTQVLNQFQTQFIAHPLISKTFKRVLISSKKPTDLLLEISAEKQNHHSEILKCEALIHDSKVHILALGDHTASF